MGLELNANEIQRIKNFLFHAPKLRQYYEILDQSFMDEKSLPKLLKDEEAFIGSKREVLKQFLHGDNFVYYSYALPHIFSMIVMSKTCPNCTSPLNVILLSKLIIQTCLTCGSELRYEIKNLHYKNIEFKKLTKDLVEKSWDEISGLYAELMNNVFPMLDKYTVAEKPRKSEKIQSEPSSYIIRDESDIWTIPDNPIPHYTSHSTTTGWTQ